jgi:hypothetical protein
MWIVPDLPRVTEGGNAKVYGTYPTEQEAREVAERLGDERRAAIVMSVQQMWLTGDPVTPRTVNPWAVLVRA